MAGGFAMSPHRVLKDYPVEMRPREKMVRLGSGALSDSELLAILIGTGSSEQSALELAQTLLKEGGMRFLAQAGVEDLTEDFTGMGRAKACQIKAAVELGKRISASDLADSPVIHTPQEAAGLVLGEMSHLDREQFRVMNLNSRNQVLAVDIVSIGSLTSSPVHPREVFKTPLKRSAASVILFHNHPSGDTNPSSADVDVTVRLKEAGKILGIEVLDHLIIGYNKFLSMKENGFF
jgi:DNA repair protein RadC